MTALTIGAASNSANNEEDTLYDLSNRARVVLLLTVVLNFRLVPEVETDAFLNPRFTVIGLKVVMADIAFLTVLLSSKDVDSSLGKFAIRSSRYKVPETMYEGSGVQ